MNEDRDNLLLRLESPFTWNLSEFDKLNKINWELKQDDNYYIPEEIFTTFLLSTYVQVLNLKYEEADNKLSDAELIIDKFKNPIKKTVARHIFDATKVNLLVKKENLVEADKILKNIESIENKIYLSSLCEIKASIWGQLKYHTYTIKTAINFAKMAIEENPKAATAHYLVAKHLRIIRKLISAFSRPDREEIFYIKKAYALEKNPQFGLFMARILLENKDFVEAYIIFEEIERMNIKNVSIQLRLSLAFIGAFKLETAKKCLDFVEAHAPDESMFLHYKGLYLMKKHEYEEAEKSLRKATFKDMNYNADMSYVQCMTLLKKPFDYISHFLKLKEKYSNSENARRKAILLNIAFCYYHLAGDLENSIKYFLQGLDIKDENLSLQYFHNEVTDKKVDVYRFLINDLLPEVENVEKSPKTTLCHETILAVETLRKICYQQYQSNYFNYKTNARRIY